MKNISICAIVCLMMTQAFSQGIENITLASSFVNEVKYGKFWYNQFGKPVNKESDSAYYYEHFITDNIRVTHKIGTQSKELYSISYIKKGEIYRLDGGIKQVSESGQKVLEGQFKDGVQISDFKGWYPDGNVRFEYPVNGTAKSFDQNGKVALQGPMQNGVAHGEFFYYTSDSTMETYVFKNGEKNGLAITYKNKERECERWIRPEYEENDKYDCIYKGIQRVKTKKGLYGFINSNGQEIIKPQYKWAEKFYSSNLTRVSMNPEPDGNFGISSRIPDSMGVIDRTGKLILPMVHWEIKIENEYIIAASRAANNKFGVTDHSGKQVLPFVYSDIDYLSPLLFVAKRKEWKSGDPDSEIFKYHSIIDRNGNEIIPLEYYSGNVTVLNNKLIRVNSASTVFNPKCFIYDYRGESLFTKALESVNNFFDDMALIREKTGGYGFMDEDGKLIIPAKYRKAFDFSEGLAIVGMDDPKGKYIDDYLYGYIDKVGKEAIPIQYKWAGAFKEGKAKVSVDGKNYFYIDKKGNKIN